MIYSNFILGSTKIPHLQIHTLTGWSHHYILIHKILILLLVICQVNLGRIKVRARWYGSNTKIICNDFLQKNIHFNIELKRKDNNLSDKHILDQIYLRNSSEHLQRISFIEKSLNNNVNLRSYGLNDYLSAAVFVSYEREYYEIIGNSTVRLTIDKNINYSTKDSNSNDGKLSHDFSIVELKFNPVQREKVADMMSSFPFRQMRFSKYLSAISKIKLISY